jgi:predicted component of viral defense system (DUF524 family)
MVENFDSDSLEHHYSFLLKRTKWLHQIRQELEEALQKIENILQSAQSQQKFELSFLLDEMASIKHNLEGKLERIQSEESALNLQITLSRPLIEDHIAEDSRF